MQIEQTSDTRDKIIKEASRLFAARGVEGVSMREIASEVGLSKPGLYYYFEDKETLVLAILVANLERVVALVENAAKAAPDTRSRLAYLIRGFFSMTPEQRGMIRMANRQFPTLGRTSRKAFDRIYQQKFIGKISEILSEGMQRGEIRTLNPLRTTWAFLGMLYPFFSAETGDSGDPTEDVLGIFMDGAKSSWPSHS